MREVPLCTHIKANGLRCKAPALTHECFCFFHHRLHKTHSQYRHAPRSAGYLLPGQHIQLIALEDRESVQIALSQVINALATGHLNPKTATALLYGLQLASANAAGLHLQPEPRDCVREIATTPDGLDLALEGVTVDLDAGPMLPVPRPAAPQPLSLQ